MKTCKECGSRYYQIKRLDIGLCEVCVEKAAAALTKSSARRVGTPEEEKRDHLPSYRRDTQQAFKDFYAKRSKRRRRKPKAL